MLGSVVIARRLGPSAGGWAAALPVALAVAVAAVGARSGMPTAAAVALSAAGHVGAQVLFAVVFAAALRRRGLAAGALAGTAAYAAASLALAGAPPVLGVALGCAALLAGPRLIPAERSRPASVTRWPATAAVCLAAAGVVTTALLATRFAGPELAGTLTAFPTTCLTLTTFAVALDGRAAGAGTLLGLVRSLPCYLVFCLVTAVTATVAGPASVAAGLLACLATAAVTWRRVPLTCPGAPHTERVTTSCR
jgi:hypothetical protein